MNCNASQGLHSLFFASFLWTLGQTHDPFLLPHLDVVLPERPKLKFMTQVPNLKKAKEGMKKLRDIQGPTKGGSTFSKGQYAIVVCMRAKA